MNSYNDPYKDFLRQTTGQGQPQQPQYQPQPYQPMMQTTTNPLQLVRVNGMAGAEHYGRQLPPNVQTACFDGDKMIAYIIVTDGGNYPTVTAYDLSPHVEEQPQQVQAQTGDFITRTEFNEFKSIIETAMPKPKTTAKAKEVASE